MLGRISKSTKILTAVTHTAILAIFGFLLFFFFLPYGAPSRAAEASAILPTKVQIRKAPLILTKATVIGSPIRLKIPKIGVNAKVDLVGLLPDGSMGTPKIPSNVAWYKLGPRPGEIGSAAIAGHINWWTGAAASFAKLNKLKIGDKITVQDDKGKTFSFVVKKIKNYDALADATEVFFSNDGVAHLNLITCTGVWNKKSKQYSQRLVVFADKE